MYVREKVRVCVRMNEHEDWAAHPLSSFHALV